MKGNAMTDTTAAPNPAADTSAAPLVTQSGDFTPEQLRVMASDLVNRGRLTREQADAMLAEDGVPQAAQPETGLTPEAAEIDAAFPPARPQDFEFPTYNGPGEGLTPEQSKFDALARGWLSDARFTREIGSSLAKEIEREARAQASMSPIDRTLYGKSQRITLERLWGAETDNKIRMAKQLVRKLDARRPGLLAMLEKTGVGNNARLVATLANQAERLAARRVK